MITIQSDRGYVTPKSWEEVLELPGFKQDVVADKQELKEIIGRYAFTDKVPCGLMKCRQPHNKGYIVVTKDGLVTNVGNKCGGDVFGVEFKHLSRAFNQAVTEQSHRKSIASFQFTIEEKLEEVRRLREEAGGDWLYKSFQKVISPSQGSSKIAADRLVKMIRFRDSSIEIDIEADEAYVSVLEAQLGKKIERPHYLPKNIGSLDGLAFGYQENDLKDLLVFNLQKNSTS